MTRVGVGYQPWATRIYQEPRRMTEKGKVVQEQIILFEWADQVASLFKMRKHGSIVQGVYILNDDTRFSKMIIRMCGCILKKMVDSFYL